MVLALKSLAYLIISFFVVALTLFLSAGTIAWSAGWVYLILLYSVSLIGMGLLFKYNPGLLQERMSLAQPGQ
ncbi:MAG TPA: hypothetical protein VFN35_30365, partial [Ktedonobacteraceae bacterium]|nr:hypothetical protein [Ktedonobacteraceae bacterium]